MLRSIILLFIVITFSSTSFSQTKGLNISKAFTSKVGPAENVRILANPRFMYREVYERELKGVALERTGGPLGNF